MTICITLLTYHYINNKSKTIFISEFYWESGIELHLRENGTFKVINDDWFSGSVSYGDYTKFEKNIVIEDEIRLGNSIMKDTLRLDSLGLHFELEEEWEGIINGKMEVRKNEIFLR